MRLDDPEDKLGSPNFGDDFHTPTGNGGDGGPPNDPGGRFNPSPLTDHEMSSIRHALERNQRRRKNYHSGQLRVYVDGEETATFTRDCPLDSFIVPRTASCIQVFGEDDEGELLLAVFPLNYLELSDNTLDQHLYVTHDGGQTIELSISPISGQSHETLERLVRLEHTESSDQLETDTTVSDHMAAGTFPDRENSWGGINVNNDPSIREERFIYEQPAYLTRLAAVDSDSAALHRDFWAKACEVFTQRLSSHALRLTNGSIYDAEDLVQGTVCRALMYPKNPEGIRSPFGYLLTIMRHIWSSKWRKEGTADMVSLDELLSKEAQQKQHRSIEPEVLQILENQERRAEMRAKQGPLTPREKLLLELHLEGYTCKEIADKLKEDVRIVRADLNAVRTKVLSRLMAAKKRTGS